MKFLQEDAEIAAQLACFGTTPEELNETIANRIMREALAR
jgi:hypothetical protein